MARYKPVDRHLSKLLPVNLAEQIIPGTFEYALNWLVDFVFVAPPSTLMVASS